ncbi:MAG TPA: hypothetical protein VGE52_11770, partial [Pirellulales bacterium]
ADAFDVLQAKLSSEGPEAALETLGQQMLAEKRFHELFDVRRMQARHKLGLSVLLSIPLDDLDEATQSRLEELQLAACREVGELMLKQGDIPGAWIYLRIVNLKKPVAEALEAYEPQEEELDVLIQVALGQGVAPRRAFEWILEYYGTCNAVTMFERESEQLRGEARESCAALLVSHLYKDLLGSLRREIARQEGSEPEEAKIEAMVADRDWLFADNAYHVDTSHLSMVVRFARWCTQPESLTQALDLTAYGRRLAATFQYETEQPFKDLYADHARFFEAQLGRNVDANVAFFRKKAEEFRAEEVGLLPAETCVALLTRLKRYPEAFDAHVAFIPAQARTADFAMSLVELACVSGQMDRWQALCKERGDRMGFVAALLSGEKK